LRNTAEFKRSQHNNNINKVDNKKLIEGDKYAKQEEKPVVLFRTGTDDYNRLEYDFIIIIAFYIKGNNLQPVSHNVGE
jgi:hypothetical protein